LKRKFVFLKNCILLNPKIDINKLLMKKHIFDLKPVEKSDRVFALNKNTLYLLTLLSFTLSKKGEE